MTSSVFGFYLFPHGQHRLVKSGHEERGVAMPLPGSFLLARPAVLNKKVRAGSAGAWLAPGTTRALLPEQESCFMLWFY